MGAALCEQSSAARALYALADEVTGLPITRLCCEGSLEELTPTDIAQVAVVTTSLASVAAAEELLGGPIPAGAAAGHSVGEMAALGWAGALDSETALRLVRQRGALMAEASSRVDGTMAAIFGIDAATLDVICGEASEATRGRVQVANLNAPDQIVISGERGAIERVLELARSQGAQRAVPLKVAGPFHSIYMEPAAEAFRSLVAEANFQAPRVPIVLNVTADAETDPERLRAELIQQIIQPVRWSESLQTLWRMGYRRFVELGPGKVLTNLVRRTLPEAEAVAVGTPEAARQLAEAIGADHA